MLWLLVLGAQAEPGWMDPPDPIAEMLDAPRAPTVRISPDQRWLLEFSSPDLPPIAELAEPEVAVAGLRINPRTNGPSRASAWTGIAVKPLSRGEARPVTLPEGARVRDLTWSPDARHLAFTLTEDDGIALWVLEVESREARQLTEPVLNAAYGSPCSWQGDDGLLCQVIPVDRGPAPERSPVATGPRIEETLGRATPGRTWTNLLQDAHDEQLFDHFLLASVQRVGLDGRLTEVLPPARYAGLSPSPDGHWLVAWTIERPYSTKVPLSRFPQHITVHDRDGTEVHRVAELPLADAIPLRFGSTREGPRSVSWRADRPATLTWVEALDGGDARREVEHRDAVWQLEAPFDGEPALLARTALRYGGIRWGRDDLALLFESWHADRRTRTWRIDPSDPQAEPVLLVDRSTQDRYGDPGSPLTRRGEHGRHVLRITSDGGLLLSGRGVSPEGTWPFLDRLDLQTGETRRLWQAADPFHESVVDVLDDDARRFLTWRQSATEHPNLFLRRQGRARAVPLTDYGDPLPWFAEVRKQVLRYEREDGLTLSGTLFLPPGHDPARDGPLPTILWVYPNEFRHRSDAAQVTATENTFSRPRGSSHLFLLTQGYAVLHNPTMPIVGEGDEEPNDTYVEQLVQSAQAAVDHLVQMGVADPDRVAIGGHSYGAFTAANLLAHSDLFRAAIARSGAYNRTLTPFGFQGEQRTFWEAADTYLHMSPFAQADRIDQPILLLHGADDPNAGTWPMQSQRLFEALRGLGGVARWVELPHEGHGYRSREAVGHALYEMATWADRWVRDAAPRAVAEDGGEAP